MTQDETDMSAPLETTSFISIRLRSIIRLIIGLFIFLNCKLISFDLAVEILTSNPKLWQFFDSFWP